MVDFILGLILAALAVRGWVRGLIREVLNLVGLVAGLFIAFRLSKPFGDFLAQSFGVTPEIARIGAGIALFVLFGVAMGIAAHYLSKALKLPGLKIANRLGGAFLALAWGVFLVLVFINLMRVLPLPRGVEDAMESSAVADAIAGEGAIPQGFFERVVGDRALTALATIQDLFGDDRAVPDLGEVLEIPRALLGDLTFVDDEADVVIEEINQHRTGLGLGALQPSETMSTLVESLASEAYTQGQLAVPEDCRSALSEVGMLVADCDSSVALAATSLAALDGILERSEGAAVLENPAFDRVGVAVIDGPTGTILLVLVAR